MKGRDLRQIVISDWLNSPEHAGNWLVDSEKQPDEVYPSNYGFTNIGRIRQLMGSHREDGSWPEVDYADKRRECWPAVDHFITYLHPLVLAYAVPGAPLYHNRELRTSILRALDFWLKSDFLNSNWWYNMIGVPAYYLGPALLVMREELEGPQLEKGAAILGRCDLKKRAGWRTGGNALYDCRAALFSGLFGYDEDLVSRVFQEELYKWLCVTPAQGSGVKEDYSHWEHGNLLFNHGYGSLVLVEGARMISYARRARIPIETQALEFLTEYLLEGSQWMARAGFLDYAADGRGVASPEVLKAGKASYLAIAARYLLRAGASRERELKQVIARERGDAPVLRGNRLFSFSDFMIHSRPEFYASVRFSSSRTLNTEICNGANRLGYFLGTGSMYIVRRGDEYKDIFPVWDWKKVPGTTVALADLDDHGIDELADSGWFPQDRPHQEGFGRARLRVSRLGRTAFAGGASNGQYGVAALDQAILSRTARKSWFFFDAGYVCLGAGIEDMEPSPMVTTVNQCHLAGKVTVIDQAGIERTLHTGSYALPGIRAVHHDGILYLFPEPQQVVCSNQIESGDWRRINVNQPDTPVEREVFSLWLEHGAMPRNAGYCYYVLPGRGLSVAIDWMCGFRVISNTARIQAVQDTDQGVIGMVFFDAGMLDLGKGRFIRASAACIMMLIEKENVLYVADPTWTTKSIHIELNGQIIYAELSCGRTAMFPVGKPDQ